MCVCSLFFLRPADPLHSVLGQGLGNWAAKLRHRTVDFSCSFFFCCPADALLSSEPGGGQGTLATHTVAQDCMFCLLFFFMRVILFLSAMRFQLGTPPPRRTVGSATSPVRVRFPLSSSRAPPATLAVRGRVLALVSLIIAPAFSFNRLSSSRPPPPRWRSTGGVWRWFAYHTACVLLQLLFFAFSWLHSLAVQRCGSGF